MTWNSDTTYVSTNQDGSTISAQTTTENTYTYEWGKTYTNYYFQDFKHNGNYGTNTPADALHHRRLQTTNTASAPWVNGALAVGTLRDYGLDVEHRWIDGVVVSNYINAPWDLSNANYQATYSDGSMWPVIEWSYSLTNGADTTVESYSKQSTVKLATTGTNGSALFCLTGTVHDWSAGYASPLTDGWTLAEEVPDAAGRVFKVFDNGSTNDVSVELDAMACGSVTNWKYSVSPGRVTLGIEWKGTGTNDTNWQTGPVYVLKDTTVTFRVATSVTNVAWPSGLPTWSHGGTAGATTISIIFSSVSGTTNGELVTVTAGTTASLKVVVFDYSVKFKPQDAAIFPGRATNTTRFGVGEMVDFLTEITPAGLMGGTVGEFGWSASGMSTAGDPDDWSEYASGDEAFQAGAFQETITVIATIVSGPSFGKERTNTFDVVKPTNSFLQDILLVWTNNIWVSDPSAQAQRFFPYPNVGHTSNSMTCSKTASYFLEPRDVSFHGISVREGDGPYLWDQSQTQKVVATEITNSSGQLLFWVTNSFGSHPNHPTGNLFSVSHPLRYSWGPVEANYWIFDTFWTTIGSNSTNLPVLVPHVPQKVVSLTGTIAIEFYYKSSDFHLIKSVLSEREVYSSGKVIIKKAGSGPHPKEYSDPSSPP